MSAKIEKNTRYFVDVDEDGRFYLIKVEDKEEWQKYINLPYFNSRGDENEERWNVPKFVIPIDGIHKLTFINPIEE